MLLALALHTSIPHAGLPAGFGETPGVVNEATPHYDLGLLYHDGKAHSPDKRLLLRLPAPARTRRLMRAARRAEIVPHLLR
jgi:hypothetical protein